MTTVSIFSNYWQSWQNLDKKQTHCWYDVGKKLTQSRAMLAYMILRESWQKIDAMLKHYWHNFETMLTSEKCDYSTHQHALCIHQNSALPHILINLHLSPKCIQPLSLFQTWDSSFVSIWIHINYFESVFEFVFLYLHFLVFVFLYLRVSLLLYN